MLGMSFSLLLSPVCHISQLCLIKVLHKESERYSERYRALRYNLKDERYEAGPTCTKAWPQVSAAGIKVPQVCKEPWCGVTFPSGTERSWPMQSHHKNEKRHLGLVDTWGKEGQKKQSLSPYESSFQEGKQNGNCSLQNMSHMESQFAAYTKGRFHPWLLTCHITMT